MLIRSIAPIYFFIENMSTISQHDILTFITFNDCHIINPASTSHIVSSVLHHSKILLGEWGVGGEYRVCGVCVDHTVKGVDVDFTVFKENVFDKMCV